MRREVFYNAVANMLPQGLIFILTPYLTEQLGLERFGIWSVGLSVSIILLAADLGVALVLIRYIPLYLGRGDVRASRQLFSAAVALVVLLAGTLALLSDPLADAIVSLLEPGEALREEAHESLKRFVHVASVMLLGSPFAAFLRSVGRFDRVAVAAAAGVAAFIVFVVATPADGRGVERYVSAAFTQSLTVVAVLFGAAWLAGARVVFSFPRRDEVGGLVRFAWQSQIAMAAGLIMLQASTVLAGALLSLRAVGIYGAAATFAAAFRIMPIYALLPIRTLLSRVYGGQGLANVVRTLAKLEHRWRAAITAYALIGSAIIALIMHLTTEEVGATGMGAFFLLCAGYAISLRTGIRVAFASAIGRPDFETASAVAGAVVVVALGLVLGRTFGAVGIALASALAHVVAAAYVARTTTAAIRGQSPAVRPRT